MKKASLLIILLIGAFSFYAGPFGYSEETHPQRIISLGPAITEELYILGAGSKLVGCTVYCRRPEQAKTKDKVGTAIEVNLEKVVSLEPDLVLATSLTKPEAKEKLKNLGIKVITFPAAKSFNEICRQFLELGRMVGKEKEAEEIVYQAKARVELIKGEVGDLPKPKVFVQIGARPLHTVTGDSVINDAVEFAGGINIACGWGMGLCSREKVLEDNPDVIVIIDMGIAGEEEKEIWRRYQAIKAVKNNKIYVVSAGKYCSPTPLSFVEALEEMAKILHSPRTTENHGREAVVRGSQNG